MKSDGGLAFPIGSGDMRDPNGMTLRDYFAAKALQGMMSIKHLRTSDPIFHSRAAFDADDLSLAEPAGVALTREAYKFADAMIAERDK